jgi:hypothetical protein
VLGIGSSTSASSRSFEVGGSQGLLGGRASSFGEMVCGLKHFSASGLQFDLGA